MSKRRIVGPDGEAFYVDVDDGIPNQRGYGVRRTEYDPEWADEVMRRWQRRRYRVQQREKATADLVAAFHPALMTLDRVLRRWPAFYRWLSR